MSNEENQCPLLNLPCKEKDSYSLRDVYDELWRGRDFEISHLWQRSVFLAVFMLAIAGGYGTYMMEVMFSEESNSIEKKSGTLKDEAKQINAEISVEIKKMEDEKQSGNIEKYKKLAPIFLTYLGIIFSMMWIMMAKGSKYCFERYELGIDSIIEDRTFNQTVDDTKVPCHGNLPDLEDKKKSDYILSPLAGRYSVSKINITIGIVALLFWCCLNILHIHDVAPKYGRNGLLSFFVSLVIAILTYNLIYFTLAVYCKSS